MMQEVNGFVHHEIKDGMQEDDEATSVSSDIVSLPDLLKRMSNRSSSKRMSLLLEAQGPLKLFIARQFISDINRDVRCLAVDELGEIGKQSDWFRLLSALSDSDWMVRSSAAISLVDVFGKRSQAALQALLPHEKNPVVIRDVAISLSYCGSDAAVTNAIRDKLARSKSIVARCGLQEALYRLRNKDALPGLLQLAAEVSIGPLDTPHLIAMGNVIQSLNRLEFDKAERELVIVGLQTLVDAFPDLPMLEDARSLIKDLQSQV